MRLRSIPLVFPFSLAMLLAGCAPASRVSTDLFHPEYSSSRDGALQYRLPVGWFDATADPQAAGHAAWLMRSDYGATMALDEVRLDSGARAEVRSAGLLPLSYLIISLTSGDRGTVLLEPPSLVTIKGKEMCRYTLVVSETKDTLQVTVIDTGDRVYTVTALDARKGVNGGGSLALLAEAFVAALRW
jgi:hypothetical protein